MLAALLATLAHAAPDSALLEAHNRVRAQAGALPLRWNEALAAGAAAHAQQLAASGQLTASDAVGSNASGTIIVGENVSAAKTPEAAAGRWFAQQEAHDARRCAPEDDHYATCGHYAAAVAPYALSLGCGWAEGVLVCRYGG